MIVTDITKRYNENLPLLKKLALVDVPNLYGLFNTLIADFCKQKCKDILENKPYHHLNMSYGDDMSIDNIKYIVSFYEENIYIEVNPLIIVIQKKFIDKVQETILEMNFERFYELYVKNVYVKE
jgi:hypothetical protein